MKKILNRRSFWLAVIMILVVALTGCGKSPEFSDTYLLSVYYGGSSWGDFYECLDGRVTLRRDGTLEVYKPEIDILTHTVSSYTLVETLTLDAAAYYNIEDGVDLKKLYNLNPRPDELVLDGYSEYIIIYDENDNVLKSCGGYMPQNKQFHDMYSVVFDNLPMNELNQIREEWIEELKSEKSNSEDADGE